MRRRCLGVIPWRRATHFFVALGFCSIVRRTSARVVPGGRPPALTGEGPTDCRLTPSILRMKASCRARAFDSSIALARRSRVALVASAGGGVACWLAFFRPVLPVPKLLLL